MTLLIAFIYFYLFARGQQRFMQFWGISWLAYSFSLLFLILFINGNVDYHLLEMRKILDMGNLLFLLFGTYSFTHTNIPSYWARFSLYMLIWVLLGIFYHFDLLSIYLPVSIYQLIITLALCWIILKYWKLPVFEKSLSICLFALWGAGKSFISIFEFYYHAVSTLYLGEIILSNVLNLCIFAVYIKKTQEEVNVAQALYKILAENAIDAIFYYKLKPQPSFTYVTPSIETLTGYSPNEFYAYSKFYLNLADKEDFNLMAEIFAEPNPARHMYSFQVHRKDGSTFWGEINRTIIYEKDIPIATEGILRDNTKLKDAELKQISLKHSRDLLLSYISHELKTPVTSIMGYVNAINDGTLSNPNEIGSALEIISAKTVTLEHLIDDLLQLSKLEMHQFSFHFMLMNVDELSRNLVKDHLLDIKTAGLKPVISINHADLKGANIIVDIQRIDQVFSNIIFNAIKYTKAPNKITLKFELDLRNNFYVVSITDTGAGIPREDIPFIFDRFYKTTIPVVAGKEYGSGLGLTLSKEIIEAHKGEISVKSVLGRGSTFTFKIPLFQDDF